MMNCFIEEAFREELAADAARLGLSPNDLQEQIDLANGVIAEALAEECK